MPNLARRRVVVSIDDLSESTTSSSESLFASTAEEPHGEIITFDVRGVVGKVAEYSLPLVTHEHALEGRVSVTVPFDATARARVNAHHFDVGLVFTFGSGAEMVCATAGAAKFATIAFHPGALERSASGVGAELSLPEPGESRATRHGNSEHLRAVLVRICGEARARGRAAAEGRQGAVADELTRLAVDFFAPNVSDAHELHASERESVRIVHVCATYAAACSYQHVALRDLAHQSGVSERRVRLAFRDCYGLSPTAYLRIAALNKVRRALLAHPELRGAVSRAACDFGFDHLGRFAAQYRGLFGEPPSTTRNHGARAATCNLHKGSA